MVTVLFEIKIYCCHTYYNGLSMDEGARSHSNSVSTPSIASMKTLADSPAIYTPPEMGRGRGNQKGGIESHRETDARPGSHEQQSSPPKVARETGAQRVGLGGFDVDHCLSDDVSERLSIAGSEESAELDWYSDDGVDAVYPPPLAVDVTEETNMEDGQRYMEIGSQRWRIVDDVTVGQTGINQQQVLSCSRDEGRKQQRLRVPEGGDNSTVRPLSKSETVHPRSDRVIGVLDDMTHHSDDCRRFRERRRHTVSRRKSAVLLNNCTDDEVGYESTNWPGRRNCWSKPRSSGQYSYESPNDSDVGSRIPTSHLVRRRVSLQDVSDEDEYPARTGRSIVQRRNKNVDRFGRQSNEMGSRHGLCQGIHSNLKPRVNVRSPSNERKLNMSVVESNFPLRGKSDNRRASHHEKDVNQTAASKGRWRSSCDENKGSHLKSNRGLYSNIYEITDDEESRQATPYGSEDETQHLRSCRRKRSDLKPVKYDGTTSVDTFLIQFETCADYNNWEDKQKAAQLKCCLGGAVGQILWEAGDPGQLSYRDLVKKLKARYGSAGQKELFVTQLRTRRRRPNETLAELYRDIKRLMALAYPNTSGSELHEEIAKSHFISSLGDREFQLKLQEKEAKDLDALFTTAVRLEAYQCSYQEVDSKENKSRGRHNEGLASRVATIEKKLKDGDTVESRCQELLRIVEKERTEKERLNRELDRLKFLHEQRQAHENVQNRAARQETAMEHINGAQNTERRNRQVKCYRCHDFGHYARDCNYTTMKLIDTQPTNGMETPINPLSNTATVTQNATGQVCGAESGITTREAFLRLRILGRRVDCLLDTGSEVTLIPAKLVGSMPLQSSTQKLLAANGTVINVLGQISLEAKAGRHTFSITGFVSDQVVEVILGIDFLQSQKSVWCFERAEVTLNGFKHKLFQKKPAVWSRRVVAADHVTVPGRSECLIPSYVVFSGSPKQTEPMYGWITERHGLVDGLHVSRVLVPDRNVDVPVRVLNTDKVDIVVSSGTVLADLQPAICAESLDNTSASSAEMLRLQLIDELVGRVDAEVSESICLQLRLLLENYRTVFSTGEMDLGRTGVVQHEIDTGDARPFRQPLRRHPPAHQAAIQEHVSSMLKQGVIEPAQSPWASNIVLVRKKDGSLRCCVDYRQLNKVTRKDAYPLPRTDTCLDAMSGAKWFSTFDLRSSYHQVEVRPEDADKTAFICRDGLYRFVTMPFGLCDAPATFQRLMDMILSGLNFDICLVYLDDIIVFSNTTENHLERLALVLSRIQASGLKIKASKTHLLQKSVKFLGHVVSYRGIEPQREKISAVIDWPRPESRKDIKAFLGLCGYYRRFVEGFADIASPLYELLQKGRKFEWNERCDESFERMKSTLTSAPILGVPNDNDSFVLDTDASDEAIGAVLSQNQNGREVVIAFASRRLSPAQRNYCITRRELFAVVSFVKYFRHYILGRTFTVRTDHAALRWLKSVPEPIGQQARWLEQLEEYNFNIEHRAGSRHGNADAMSRRPCDRPRCCKPLSTETANGIPDAFDHSQICYNITADGSLGDDEWSADTLAKEQENDPDIRPILALIKESTAKPLWDDIASFSEESKSLWQQWDRLKVFRNILVRRFETADGRLECLQTIMPAVRRLDFIRLVHEGPSGGHLGRRRTERQVQLRAYWPGWTTDVRTALRICAPCAKYHRGKAPRQAPLKPFVAGEPWEVVSVDITGPHPRSRRGYVFILTLVDHFTKWAEAMPIRNHTATTVARVLFDHVFSRFGMPVRCLTDQGAEFESALFTQLC